MKLEPVAWMDDFGNAFPLAANKGAGSWRDEHKRNWKPLYAIPEGYVVVPVEPTEEWIANMRKGTIEPQGMDAQAKIIEGLRRNYKRWIAAAKEQS